MHFKTQKIRLDERLVQVYPLELNKAQAMIMAGQILVNEQRIDKPSQLVDITSDIRIKNQRRYVSRAGEKIHTFWHSFVHQDIAGKTVLDIGSSTGGFSDFMLQHGARRIVCVDVGTNQLDWSLRQNLRLEVHEKTDIRNFKTHEEFDFVLSDLSFISTLHLFPVLSKFLTQSKTIGVFLIKPQFEFDHHNGVVTDQGSFTNLKKRVDDLCQKLQWDVLDYQPSSVLGRSGNQEFFLCVKINQS